MKVFPLTCDDYATYIKNKKEFNFNKSYAIVDGKNVPIRQLTDTGTTLTYNDVSIFPGNVVHGIIDMDETLDEKQKAFREEQLKRNQYNPGNPYPPEDVR